MGGQADAYLRVVVGEVLRDVQVTARVGLLRHPERPVRRLVQRDDPPGQGPVRQAARDRGPGRRVDAAGLEDLEDAMRPPARGWTGGWPPGGGRPGSRSRDRTQDGQPYGQALPSDLVGDAADPVLRLRSTRRPSTEERRVRALRKYSPRCGQSNGEGHHLAARPGPLGPGLAHERCRPLLSDHHRRPAQTVSGGAGRGRDSHRAVRDRPPPVICAEECTHVAARTRPWPVRAPLPAYPVPRPPGRRPGGSLRKPAARLGLSARSPARAPARPVLRRQLSVSACGLRRMPAAASTAPTTHSTPVTRAAVCTPLTKA